MAIEKLITLILAEFKGLLRELGDKYGGSEEYGEPPAELFVEHNDGVRRTSRTRTSRAVIIMVKVTERASIFGGAS